MERLIEYAEQWNKSAEYNYMNGYYSWMAEKLLGYETILEIGCGTGYSTLALLEKGFKVIAVDKNKECIDKAKVLLSANPEYINNVIFVEADFIEDGIDVKLSFEMSFDIVICWNMGTYENKSNLIQYYNRFMLEYGLNQSQILDNPESSYAELVLWKACGFAKVRNLPVHIVDRSKYNMNEENKKYYTLLGKEFSYSGIYFDSCSALARSKGARVLSISGVPSNNELVNIYYISVLIK